MLKPDYFDDKSDIIVGYYQQLEDWILQDIAQRMLESEGVSGTADWRLWKLQQMGMHRNEMARKLSKLTGMSQKEVKSLLQDAVSTSWKDDLKTFLRMGKDIPDPLKSKKYMDLINAEYVKTLGHLDNLTNTTLKQSQSDLINLLNQAEMFTSSGTMSYSEAVNYVLDEYAKKGVTVVEYDSGYRRSVESAVETAIRTSMNQTAGQLTNQYIVDEGVEYVLVSAHTGARHVKGKETQPESHDWWQGKVYKIRGSEEGYPNLLESTGYDITASGKGIVANKCGLHGINCRHSHQPWDKDMGNPWVDGNGKPLIDHKESIEKYENQQKQRTMERSIRSSKRQLLVKQEEIDACKTTEEKEKLQADYDRLAFKLREKNQRYNDFCKEHDLQKQAERVKVMRWNREQNSIANGRASAYKNSAVKLKKINDNVQHYKTLEVTNNAKYFSRDNGDIVASKFNNYNMYYSSNAYIKPKDLHNIELSLESAKKILKIQTNEYLPDIVIASYTEMKSNSLALYNRDLNAILINDKIMNTKTNVIETLVHEFIHWKDAKSYIDKFGALDNKYMNYLIDKCKKKVVKLEKEGYDILVSTYAEECLFYKRYDEVYTEIRTKEIMKGAKYEWNNTK